MLRGIAGGAGLGAGVDHVEDVLLLAGVVAGLLVALVPVRILDDEVHLRVDGPGQVHDLVGELLHQAQAVVLPGLVALGLDAHLAPAGGEEEVVQDDLVKHARKLAHDALVLLAVAGIGVAERVVIGGLALPIHELGGRDAARGLDAVLLEERLDLPQALGRDVHHAAVVLDVDLVQMDVLLEVVDSALDLGVVRVLQIVGVDVGRDLEVLERFHDNPLVSFLYLANAAFSIARNIPSVKLRALFVKILQIACA